MSTTTVATSCFSKNDTSVCVIMVGISLTFKILIAIVALSEQLKGSETNTSTRIVEIPWLFTNASKSNISEFLTLIFPDLLSICNADKTSSVFCVLNRQVNESLSRSKSFFEYFSLTSNKTVPASNPSLNGPAVESLIIGLTIPNPPGSKNFPTAGSKSPSSLSVIVITIRSTSPSLSISIKVAPLSQVDKF